VLQLAFTLHTRNVLVSAAQEGARYAANADRTPADGVARTEQAIREALDAAGFDNVFVQRVLFPPWTTDWITERGRERLKAFGIAPPDPNAKTACPRCGSMETHQVSRFGSTPCKALWRCDSCQEPFDRFKCH